MDRHLNPEGLRRILDGVALGIFAVDADWNITFINREAERITGFQAHEALGEPCRKVFHSDRCEQQCYLRQAMNSGRNVVKARFEIVNRRNRRIPVEVTAAVLHDENGVVVGGVESILDLTVRQQLEKSARQAYRFSDIVGRDPSMLRLFETVRVVAPNKTTVLLQGETGTGKDLVARAIHNHSSRADKPFVKINCAAIPANLFESELFGYHKGAFTDARQNKPGLFAKAQGGSVFLDEVGEIPLEAQAKLLQVLDEQSYFPLGASEPETLDVRVIAATNRDLAIRVEKGEFRADLYYRLKVVELRIPPLRKRRCDIALLMEHLLEEFAALHGKLLQGFSPRAMQCLLDHDYPGNVRELRHIVEHGVILAASDVVRVGDLPQSLRERRLPNAPDPADQPDQALVDERERLRKELDRHNWRVAETAAALGVDRTTLWRKKKRLGL